MAAGGRGDKKDPYSVALRLLGRRDHSCNELRRKLRQRGFEPEAVDAALARCLELGYLDDQRYAEQLAGSFTVSGRAVGRRLELELRKRGIDATLAERARTAAETTTDTVQLITEITARRYPGFFYTRAADAERRRVVNFFLRRGFVLQDILAALTKEENR